MEVVAVNTTSVPAQIVVVEAVMKTDGAAVDTICILSTLDVTDAGAAQLALEVSTQLITSPLLRFEVV